MDYRAIFLTIPLLTSALHPAHAGLTTPESNAPKKSMTAHQLLTLSSFFKPEPKGYRQTASPVQYTFKGAVDGSINYIHLCTATDNTCSVCTTNYQVINMGKPILYTLQGTLYGIPAASVAAYLHTQALPAGTYNVGMYLQSTNTNANCTGPSGATYCSTNIDTASPLPHVLCMQATYDGTNVTNLAQTDNKNASLTTPAPPVTVPAFPQAVTATAGSGQVTVSWTPPNNPYDLQPPGGGVVTDYTVNYGETSTAVFTTFGCTPTTATATTCTVPNLNPGTSYTFTVSAINRRGQGPVSYSSPTTPLAAAFNANPSTLALSGLGGGGVARTITFTNNTGSDSSVLSVTLTQELPLGTGITGNTCIGTTIAPGGSCTITIKPGSEATTGVGGAVCTTGIAPSNVGVLTVSDSGGNSVSANVLVLGYGCKYQGGYLFSIDDTTPLTSSIGGQVVSAADQSNSAQWSSGGDFTSIWGIDYTSTIAAPSPNAKPAPDTSTAAYMLGQLNCNAENDGACATNNIVTYYSPVGTYPLNGYAAGICRQPIDSEGAVCTTGNNCYTDWYLPSVCDLGPFGSSGYNQFDYPYFGGNYLACASSNNIQQNLAGTFIVTNFSAGSYWSSTEDWHDPQYDAWYQYLASGGVGYQGGYAKEGNFGVRCVRALTL